jgi:DNA-directed RNA polymerase specialized sigma24 family protein
MHSCIDKWLAGEPAAADRMLRAAARRLELIARSSLRRFPTVSRWEGAEDILQGAVIRMIRTLHVVRPPNTRVFYHLAATHIRRELLDLARKYRSMVAPPTGDGSASWADKLAVGDQPDRAAEIDSDLASWEAFHEAVERLKKDWGADWSQWRYGRLNTSTLPHMFVPEFSLPEVERPGGFNTVNATGANFRRIIDLSNVDNSVATNAPGQSAQPGSEYYGNNRERLANGQYFPLPYTRAAVDKAATHKLTLTP